MIIDAIRQVYDAQPFRPFAIRTADGRSVKIPHREFMLITPTGRTIIVGDEEKEFLIIATELVTAVEFP